MFPFETSRSWPHDGAYAAQHSSTATLVSSPIHGVQFNPLRVLLTLHEEPVGALYKSSQRFLTFAYLFDGQLPTLSPKCEAVIVVMSASKRLWCLFSRSSEHSCLQRSLVRLPCIKIQSTQGQLFSNVQHHNILPESLQSRICLRQSLLRKKKGNISRVSCSCKAESHQPELPTAGTLTLTLKVKYQLSRCSIIL